MKTTFSLTAVLLALVTLSASFGAEQSEPTEPFPTRGILPKAEIGALRFLETHPEFDGRGVIVAIFDTGVDPGASGLRQTSDGKPKIVDMLDATGSGDVVMSTVQQPVKNSLQGLTGRTLLIGKDWENPKGEYRLGIKRAYDFFPQSLITRLKRERKKKFDAENTRLEESLEQQMAKWDETHTKPTAADRKLKADLKTRLEQLRKLKTSYEDPGPLFDCVVFHDGKVWRAVVDSDEDGDLAEEQLLTNFRAERQFATFGEGSLLNFTVNIYDDGKRLSIVTPSGAHGTHVAGIVSAQFAVSPRWNGIAPGAQIVSVKIGDSRLDSMETGAALIRALRAVIDNECDLINMSYGEPTSTPNRGRLISLFSEIVNKHGVIFVASAGNAGPALSTVGAPGGTTSALIGVGAYISPKMMAVEYTLRKKLPETAYTWTSRGPAIDGDLGVNVFAPGGAIAPVPHWTLRPHMQMNGTSMASPNACGGVALLLSGLKSNKASYSPHSVRRALENTAQPIPAVDVFAQGRGLIQIDRAFEHLMKNSAAQGELIHFAVDLPGRDGARGIYLREPHETTRPLVTTVRVRPMFHEKTEPQTKLSLNMPIALECSEPWVQCGEHLLLTSSGASFEIQVDPTTLNPGVHFTEIRGFDADHRDRGPLFRLPVTVVRASQEQGRGADGENGATLFTEQLPFEPARIVRRFFHVPAGATWADLTLRLKKPVPTSRRFVIHAVQTQAGKSFSAAETKQYVTLRNETNTVRSFSVRAGRTLELCLAQYWSSLGETLLEYELTFHGIVPDRSTITFTAAEPTAEVEIAATLGAESISPSATLNSWQSFVRPSSAKVSWNNSGHQQLPDGRFPYQLELTYRFTQKSAGTLTPRLPQLDGLLYDSPFGTNLWMIFDEGKRRVAADDIFPGSVRLGKGSHVLKVQVRHTDSKQLEKLKSMPLVLERSLGKSISLSIAASRAASASEKKLSQRRLSKGERLKLSIAGPQPSQIPAAVSAGDLLIGKLNYGKPDSSQTGSGQRPGGFPIRYAVPAKKTSAASPSAKTEPSAKDLREFKISRLKAIPASSNTKTFEKLAAKLLKKYPHDLDVLTARLHWLDDVKYRKERLKQVVQAADAIIEQIDTSQLATHFGTRINPEDKQAAALRKKLETRRELLIDTLYRKGRAVGYMELPDVIEKHPITDPAAHDAAFESNFAELRKWADTTEEKYFLLHVRRERRKGRYGNALSLLNRYIPGSSPNYWYIKKRRDLFGLLGWKHLEAAENKWLLIRFPKDYEPF